MSPAITVTPVNGKKINRIRPTINRLSLLFTTATGL